METPLPLIYFIRHGETEWSLSGQHTGRTEIPLTGEGEAQARKLVPLLQEIQFDRVYVSPRGRARRTYELSGVSRAAETEPDLAEWNYGDYEGKRSAEIFATRPDWNLFADGCPEGESPSQVAERADRLLERLRTLSGKIALFSHGHFGRVLGARWTRLPVSAGQRLLLSPASISVLGYEHHSADEPTLTLWNLPSGGGLTR